MKKDKRTKRLFLNNIFNILIIIGSFILSFLAVNICSNLDEYKENILAENEEFARTYVRQDLELAKEDLVYYVNKGMDATDPKAVKDWASDQKAKLNFDDGVTHSYILSTLDGSVIYDSSRKQNKIDPKELIFFTDDETLPGDFSLDDLVHSYNDTGHYSEWFAKDADGNEYFAEWVYAPNCRTGFNGQKYTVNGDQNTDTEGIIILALKNSKFHIYKLQTTLRYVDDAKVTIYILTTVCIMTSFIFLLYNIYLERKEDELNTKRTMLENK